MESTKDQTRPSNEIKVSFKSSCRNLVNYAEKVLTQDKLRSLHFTAIGEAIGNLVRVVEILKVVQPGLYQVNRLGSISHQNPENKETENQRLYPKLEVDLLLDEPSVKTEGFQDKLTEEELKTFLAFRSTQTEVKVETPARGRGRGRGEFRGGRGEFRGGRGGFRGGRGGFRGGRGGYPTEMGEFREERGTYRGAGYTRGSEYARGTGYGRGRGQSRGAGYARGTGPVRGRGNYGGEYRENFTGERGQGGFRARGDRKVNRGRGN